MDTAVTIDHMATDFIIMRHPSSGAPFYIADRVNASVINAGDGMDEHPTQCLLDLFTMKEQLGTLSGLKVAIIGDIAHSRVARSNIWALNKFNSEVRVAGPASMMPVEFEKRCYCLMMSRRPVKAVMLSWVLRLQLRTDAQRLVSVGERVC